MDDKNEHILHILSSFLSSRGITTKLLWMNLLSWQKAFIQKSAVWGGGGGAGGAPKP
jgi:hypothetical protein